MIIDAYWKDGKISRFDIAVGVGRKLALKDAIVVQAQSLDFSRMEEDKSR